ncbi:hypothetical protein [Amycolatopsis sp. cmx-4-68]|uniref:hypothetical protein n=1 Tax=Amycolatopsis sp. cmx-4-68 TaxID=2790938 RepID=UPI00397B08B1
MGNFDYLLDTLTDSQIQKIAREGQKPSFERLVPILKSIRADLQLLDRIGDVQIPARNMNDIEQAVTQIRTFIDRALSFDTMRATSPQEEWQSIVTNLQQFADQIALNLRPYVHPDYSEAEAVFRNATTLHDQLKQQILEVADAIEQSKALLASANDSLSEIKTAAVKKASDRISVYYHEAVEQHRKTALGYLIAAASFGTILGTLVVLVFYANPPEIPATNWVPTLIKEALGRVLALLIITAAIAFCTKNYRVNKHLQVVNQTRFNALETASLYVASITTDDARNIVVSELVRSIFTPGDTGYMTTDREQTIVENPGSLISVIGATGKK